MNADHIQNFTSSLLTNLPNGYAGTMEDSSHLKVSPRLFSGETIAMGPGKADLLEAIAREGSISAAGRALGMSYRRTWMLVDSMNRCWQGPLVETAAGGSHGGGAHVTEIGLYVLEQFRALQKRIADAAKCEQSSALEAILLASPRPTQKI